MNLLAYLIYLIITYLITVHVGRLFHRNGKYFLLAMFHHDEALTHTVNNLLLTGYYLLNLGYATVMLSFWDNISNWQELAESLSTSIAQIVITLALIHYFNMIVIMLWDKISKPNTHTK